MDAFAVVFAVVIACGIRDIGESGKGNGQSAKVPSGHRDSGTSLRIDGFERERVR